MKKMIFALAALTSSFAFASKDAYELKVDLSIDGKLVSSPKIVTAVGETASIIQKGENSETFLEVVATEGEGAIKGRKAILMKFVIGRIENGVRKILSTPQIVAAESSKAEMSIGHTGEKDNITVAVVAERTSL